MRGKTWPFIKDLLLKYNSLLMLILLIIVSSALSDAFFTWRNATNLLRDLTPLMLVSLGMLLVILTGGIDLSVGSITAVGGMICAVALNAFQLQGVTGLLLAVLVSLLSGLLLGAVTGSLVSIFRMAPFVATLAMMTIARGVAYMITNGEPIRLNISYLPQKLVNNFGSESIPGIRVPWPILLGIIAIIAFNLIVKYTVFGRLTIATGSNESAVRLAGISVQKYKFLVYCISGTLAALAGIVIMSRAAIGTPVFGENLELDAIAACVIGGANLSGGKGSVINTLIGVLILGLIGNIMNLMSVPAYPQQIAKGAIIVVAVLSQRFTNKEASA